MRFRPFMHVAAILALLCPGVLIYSGSAGAQMIDFGQIDSFESMGTGTQHGGSRPKTIVDDGEWHTVLFTILDSGTDAKIYWRSPDGDQTTIIRGPSVKAFQTAGTFKVEALGNENQSFKYGYVLFRLKNNRGI
ncbi:MAG TPA: hypothetical protein VGI09_14630 [Pseudolabrys sp.]|jgi:hypothetical protein